MRADSHRHLSDPSRPSRHRLVCVVAGLLVVLAACGGGGDAEADASGDTSGDEQTTTTTTEGGSDTGASEAEHVSWVAEAQVPQVEVFAEPGAAEPEHVLDNPNENGAPLVFLVDGQDTSGDWLPVHLPVRPNGSTGFVRADDVTTVRNAYRVTVELAAHRLTVTHEGEPVLEAAIGVGTADTPTPGGIYYIKELIQPPDPTGPYGTYAYGLSGFSNELESFNGGDGVIGIHGTNDPSSIGEDVSHGCIRLTNENIDEMASYLPLGTPVEIVA